MTDSNVNKDDDIEKNIDKTYRSAFTLVRHENGIAHLVIDVIDEKVNTLKEAFSEEIPAILAEIIADKSIIGLVIISGKANSFIAGADINLIAQCKTAKKATALSKKGQEIFAQIEQMTIPVVAAINGVCLGGGLELALACHARICSDSAETVLGFPEVQLGLLPGSGGTQRLPKLVGIGQALTLMLTGKKLRAKQALKIGLVDDVVAQSILISATEKLILSGKIFVNKKLKLSIVKKIVNYLTEKNSLGRKFVFLQATKSVIAKTQYHYPASFKIIECVKAGSEHSSLKGYNIEANHFGDLVMSKESIQLRALFFAMTEIKNTQEVNGVKPKDINKIGVLGGGLMGGGIAFVSATKANVPVRLKDISAEGIRHVLKYSYDLLIEKVKRKYIRHSELQQQLAKITGTVDYQGFSEVDLVIEAVFEDLSLKQEMVEGIETHTQNHTIFASNTSSLPIKQIAKHAQRPENIIGLHYFSPVDKMPLVEIIPHEKTSVQTIATTLNFAKKQGKTAIVVKDSAGFYVNRILAPYINEAIQLLLLGEPIEKIDQALVGFGFPIGPIQLLDEVGLDVVAKIGPILVNELGERFTPPLIVEQLLAAGRLGKKAKKGFYCYGKKANKQKRVVDDEVYTLLKLTDVTTAAVQLSNSEIVQRCVYLMINEAVRCVDEGVVENTRDGNVGAILGMGFPPFLGGPFAYLETIGTTKVIAKLELWAKLYGDRYLPCEALIKMIEKS